MAGSILNRVFTRETLGELIAYQNNACFSDCVKRYIPNPNEMTNQDALSELYNILKRSYRNEYYYKNTLMNKSLFGVHSLNTATVLSEIPIYTSKADFILVNGTARVFEIKTELDNLDRIEEQITSYYKAFKDVNILTYSENVDSVCKIRKKLSRPIGISVLSKRNTIQRVMDSDEYDGDLEKDQIFRILHKNEYERILSRCGVQVPHVSAFFYHRTCKELFNQLDIDEVYREFVREIKTRSLCNREYFDQIPYELRFLAYFMRFDKQKNERLIRFLKMPYGGGTNVLSIS